MRAMVVTMVYNEKYNLPIWINYYARALGYQHLLVIDHGSDDKSLDEIPDLNKIRVPRSNFSDLKRCRFISRLQHALIEVNDVVIYTDCDEILVPDPHKFADLRSYLLDFLRDSSRCRRPVGLNVFQSRSLEQPIVSGLPILRQRSYCQIHSIYCKPIVTKAPVNWGVGFHHCDLQAAIDPDLYLFHIRDVDYRAALERLAVTRQLDWDPTESEKGLGRHHRYSDDECSKERFDGPDRLITSGDSLDFDYAAEVAQLNEKFSDFRGRVAMIPERFKAIF